MAIRTPPVLPQQLSKRALVAALLWGTLVVSATGQWPAARLHSLFPTGGAAGSTVQVQINGGEDLEEVTALRFSHPGLTAVLQAPAASPAEGQPQPPVAFAVTIAADVPPGDYEVRALGAHGLTNPRRFVVSASTETLETEPNDDSAQAQALELETIVNGRSLPARDVDCFRISAPAGQTLLVECRAGGLDSRLSPLVEVWEGSRRLVAAWQPGVDDLRFPVSVDHDATLLLKVNDFEYAGGEDRAYRLRVTAAPCVSYVMPPALLPGESRSVEVFGWNLPGGASLPDSYGLESVSLEVAAPPAESWVIGQTGQSAASAAMARWDFTPPWPRAPVAPVRFWRASAPVQLETTNNDAAATAQPIELPAEVCGAFEKPGDVDRFTFSSPVAQTLVVDVQAQRCGFDADPVFRLARVDTTPEGQEKLELLKTDDDDGANPGGRDFTTRSADPQFRFEAEAGARYRLALRDLRGDRGSGGFVSRAAPCYRLAIRPVQPDFTLVALPEFPIQPEQRSALWSVSVRRGGTEKLKLVALRRDGFNGEIEVVAEGLPPGVSCATTTLGPGQEVGYLVLSAASNAPDWHGAIQVRGQAKQGETMLARPALAGTMVWPGGEDLAAVSRLTNEIALSVGDDAAFRVEPSESALRTHQRRRWPVALRLTRHEGFQGPVTLTAFNLPPNAKCEPVTIGEGAVEATANLLIEDVPPGHWTVLFRSQAQLPKLDMPPEMAKKKRGRKQQREVADPALPLQLEVLPGPLTLVAPLPNEGQLPRGGALEIPVTVARRNGFAGPIHLSLTLPAAVPGLTAEPIDLAADATTGTITVRCAADTPAGPQPLALLRAEVDWSGERVFVEQPIPLTIP